MKSVKNPLGNKKDKKQVASLFGKSLAEKLCTTPVFKYSHKGVGEGKGDERK